MLANIFGHDIGGGLARHITVVRQSLETAGFEVAVRPVPEKGRGGRLAARVRRWRPGGDRAAVNVFLQDLVPSWFHRARANVLIPNQEWFDPSEFRLLPAIDHIVCTSQHAEDLFAFRGAEVVNLGFTSLDRLRPDPSRVRDRILHVAGRSPYKGTRLLADLWARHPEWPTLTLVHHESILAPLNLRNVQQHAGFIDDTTLLEFQNEAWLHLIPTEAEAFGHAACEALSVGALVVTTDAPPMNELVRCDRGILLPVNRRTRLNLGYRYFVDPAAMEESISAVLSNGPGHYAAHMELSRAYFIANETRVRRELSETFRQLA